MHFTRNIENAILNDLPAKMIFMGGPRQVGKTTFSRERILPSGLYLNWDNLADRDLIKSNQFPNNKNGLIFDEIHKFKNWRTLAKGLYDSYQKKIPIVCTGSARLDHFRKGGDSLFGRYRYYRLHPFSILEISANPKQGDLEALLQFGGFPEPLIKQSQRNLRLWHKERREILIRQDLSDLMRVKELSLIELLCDLLPTKVGSPLSIKSIQEDLSVSPHTVESWLVGLENLYYCFRIPPYGSSRINAVKKQKKLYLYDWSQVEEPGSRFENFVASHLYKFCHNQSDINGHKMELRYLRDVYLKEIDFVVLKNNKPIFAVECKSGQKVLSPHLKYFRERTPIPKFYQVHMGIRDFGTAELGRVLPFTEFCRLELQGPEIEN